MSEDQAPANANAPDPAIMREEFINILVAGGTGVARGKAERMIDAILAKQMEYYSAIADPTVTEDVTQIMTALSGLEGSVNALIATGAKGVPALLSADQEAWRFQATRARENVQAVLALLA